MGFKFLTREEKGKRYIFATQLSDMAKELESGIGTTRWLSESEKVEQVPDLPMIEYKIRTAAKYARDLQAASYDYSKIL